jgi:predicted ABC-type transport system involved in lysophospholipase L1 biosynthesis ATPase subunit
MASSWAFPSPSRVGRTVPAGYLGGWVDQVIMRVTDAWLALGKVRMREYPHQMSGGMCQRVVGAIAIAGGPKLIMADGPATNVGGSPGRGIQPQYPRESREQVLAL